MLYNKAIFIFHNFNLHIDLPAEELKSFDRLFLSVGFNGTQYLGNFIPSGAHKFNLWNVQYLNFILQIKSFLWMSSVKKISYKQNYYSNLQPNMSQI